MDKYMLEERNLETPSRERVWVIYGPGKNIFGEDKEDTRVRVFKYSQEKLAKETLKRMNAMA